MKKGFFIYITGISILLSLIFNINTVFSSTNDLVYPLDSKINGYSYEEWAIKYWQWWISLPSNSNSDDFDYNPEILNKCFLGSDFPVLFFVNPIVTYYLDGNKKVYDCTIPSNKPIFIVGISEMCNYNAPKENNPGELLQTEEELKTCVHTRNPYADVTLTVDNIKIERDQTNKYSLTTNFFNITIPEDSAYREYGVGTNKALLDGKFLILKPLPVGDHVINYKTVQIIPHNESDNLFLDVTYNVHIK